MTETFKAMWETWCFAPTNYGGAVCTEQKGHKGPHVCDFSKLARYHEARAAAEDQHGQRQASR